MSGAEATLYYGFYLGDPGEGWSARVSERLREEASEVEDLPWAQAALDDDDEDYFGHMYVHLLAEADVEAAELDSDGLKEAVARVWGVELVDHGDPLNGVSHIGIAMTGAVYWTDDWLPKAIAPQVKGNHEVLINALEALGLHPVQANPSWILAPGAG